VFTAWLSAFKKFITLSEFFIFKAAGLAMFSLAQKFWFGQLLN
jgi:hypothetical protein